MKEGTVVPKWGTETQTAFEHISFLARSKNRVAVLDALSRSSWRRHDLQQEAGTSRSTLARILAEFDKQGWVRRVGDEYTATTAGSLVVEELLATVDTVETIDQSSESLEAIPSSIMPLEPNIFADASVTRAEPGQPFRPAARLSRHLANSGTLRELNPSMLGRIGADLFDSSEAVNREGTVVVEPSVVASLSAAMGRPLAEVVTERPIDVHVHDSLPLRLSLFDDRLALGEYDDDTGVLTRLVVTDSREAIRWGEETFEAYASEAVPLAETDVSARISGDNPLSRTTQWSGGSANIFH